MSVAKFCIKKNWKEFNLDLNAINAWMLAHAGPECCGTQSRSEHLEIWFNNEPDQDHKDAIDAYWDALASDGAEAVSYKTAFERASDLAALRASAKAKLIAGTALSAPEAAALFG